MVIIIFFLRQVTIIPFPADNLYAVNLAYSSSRDYGNEPGGGSPLSNEFCELKMADEALFIR